MPSALDAATAGRQIIVQHPLLLLISLIVSYLCWNKFQPGLINIPGPKIAAYTKFWRVYNVWKGSAHLDAVSLHKKHGNLVRIAPNHISVADPKWISVFYGTKEEYTKVDICFTFCPGLTTTDWVLSYSIYFLEEETGNESVFDERTRVSSH